MHMEASAFVKKKRKLSHNYSCTGITGWIMADRSKYHFLWCRKFPLGCDRHVSKFPIQSLCYPCFGHLKSSGLITRLKCVTLVPRVSHLTTSWGERGETLVWAGHVLLWQLKTLGRKGKRIREGSSTIRQFVALSFVTATAINRDF